MINTISIPASGVNTVSVSPSNYFYCIASDAAFKVKTNLSDKIPMDTDKGFGNSNAKKWTKLTFYNSSEGSIDVTYWADTEPYETSVRTVSNTVITGVTNTLANCAAATPSMLLKTANAADAPVALAASGTNFRWAWLLGVKDKKGTTNQGSVFIGASSASDEQPLEILPGASGGILFPIPVGAKWDFHDWYLKVSNDGDGLVVIYT